MFMTNVEPQGYVVYYCGDVWMGGKTAHIEPGIFTENFSADDTADEAQEYFGVASLMRSDCTTLY